MGEAGIVVDNRYNTATAIENTTVRQQHPQQPLEIEGKKCAFCEAPAVGTFTLMKCSGCLTTYYCDREHQVSDWKRHKPTCKELQSRRTSDSTSMPVVTNVVSLSQSQPSYSEDVIFESQLISNSSSKEETLENACSVSAFGHRPSVIQSPTCASKRPSPSDAENVGNVNGLLARTKKSRTSQGRAAATSTPPLSKSTKSGNATSKNVDYGPKKDHSLNCSLDLERDSRFRSGEGRDNAAFRIAKAAQFAAASLREYGWSIVDKFIGERHCRAVLSEVQNLHQRGQFVDGKTIKSISGSSLHGVRSDQILWLTNGGDEGVNVALLVSVIDALIFEMAGSIPPCNIVGRSKPMLTCYPGQRSRYVTHVDNPDADGRCVTATYYLNDDWCPAHGGLLRLFPITAFKPVDIEPVFDRLVLYWSDRRNPHEILPTYRKRYSINVWYFDAEEKSTADARIFAEQTSPVDKSNSE